jgi:hypothetical protein
VVSIEDLNASAEDAGEDILEDLAKVRKNHLQNLVLISYSMLLRNLLWHQFQNCFAERPFVSYRRYFRWAASDLEIVLRSMKIWSYLK